MRAGYIQEMGLDTSITTQRLVPLHWIPIVGWIIKVSIRFNPIFAQKTLFWLQRSTTAAKNVHAS